MFFFLIQFCLPDDAFATIVCIPTLEMSKMFPEFRRDELESSGLCLLTSGTRTTRYPWIIWNIDTELLLFTLSNIFVHICSNDVLAEFSFARIRVF